jgi:hypothetical protein
MKLWGGRRPVSDKKNSDFSSAVAIIDASTVYGASRWYRSVHDDPTWEYASQYKKAEDRLLFEEFLHNLLLYDRIVLDNTSLDEVSDEIKGLMATINSVLRKEIISAKAVAPELPILDVVDHVCKLLAKGHDPATRAAILSSPVPWYYRVPEHHDRGVFDSAAKNWGLDAELIPAAIFLYRGLCYSGFANSYAKEHRTPTVYLASPGRLKALQPIISADVMQMLEYPKQAYSDLVDILGLPASGYDFSHLKISPASQASQLSLAISGKPPQAALDYVLTSRATKEASNLRLEWAKRIWSSSRSSAVGAPYPTVNTMTGVTVYGSVTQQIIHAQPHTP